MGRRNLCSSCQRYSYLGPPRHDGAGALSAAVTDGAIDEVDAAEEVHHVHGHPVASPRQRAAAPPARSNPASQRGLRLFLCSSKRWVPGSNLRLGRKVLSLLKTCFRKGWDILAAPGQPPRGFRGEGRAGHSRQEGHRAPRAPSDLEHTKRKHREPSWKPCSRRTSGVDWGRLGTCGFEFQQKGTQNCPGTSPLCPGGFGKEKVAGSTCHLYMALRLGGSSVKRCP